MQKKSRIHTYLKNNNFIPLFVVGDFERAVSGLDDVVFPLFSFLNTDSYNKYYNTTTKTKIRFASSLCCLQR